MWDARAILARKVLEAEFAVADRLPKKIRIEFLRKALSLGHQRARGQRREAEQHGTGLDLEPLARHRFHLQRRVVIGENGPGLQLAVVLEQDIHWEQARERTFT